MSIEKEAESLIPFIDDGAEVVEDENLSSEVNQGQYNLRITRNYLNKTRRVEISKILQDVEPMTNRSLSPTAPLAYDSGHFLGEAGDTEGPQKEEEESAKGETLTAAEFELTIRSNNSVIKIQGFDNKSSISFNAGRGRGDNVYEFLSREVDKIFKRPEREDIERAMRSIGSIKNGEKSMKCDRKMKPLCRQKRNTWKAFTKSLITMRGLKSAREQRRGSLERYPKMVLLQDPKPAEEEASYPKMVMMGDKTSREKKNLESEKDALRMENKEIEKSKWELIKSRKYLSQEKKRLKERKEAMQDKKAKAGEVKLPDEGSVEKGLDIISEEKLCAELEKQLLGEETVMLKEEMNLLKKEKEILQKEKSLLGEEINFLEEEKAMFESKGVSPGEQEEGQRLCSDVDDMLTGNLRLCPSSKLQGKKGAGTAARQQESCFHSTGFEGDDLGYSSVPPLCCQYAGRERYHCPSVYMPVYSRPFPCYQYGASEFCHGGKMEGPPVAQKSSTTQTESEACEAQVGAEPSGGGGGPPESHKVAKDLDLPFGIISSFFPRIVVMKSFQEEVSSDDADPKIFEIPKGESPPPATTNEKEDEKACGESEVVRSVDLEVEAADEEVASLGMEFFGIDGAKESEAGTHATGTEEKDEKLEATADQTETGGEVTGNEDFPLTKIGYSIYDKLNELALERKGGGEAEAEGAEAKSTENGMKKSAHNAVTLELSSKLVRVTVGEDNLKLQMFDSGEGEEGRQSGGASTADTHRKCVTDDKMVVRRSELWHPSNGNGRIPRNEGAPEEASSEISLSISDRQNLIFTIQVEEGGSKKRTSEAKVGTDSIDIAGGHFVCQEGTDMGDLSPRTDRALKSLREKLDGGKRQNAADRRGEFKFPGLFLIQPIDSRRTFPSDDFILTKEREKKRQEKLGAPGKAREYYCEECLATMRLLEDEDLSVKSIVDKFEQIIHLGSY